MTDIELISKEALRQTEIHLEDFNSLATSADQRAMAFGTILTAMATLIAAFAKSLPAPLLSYVSAAALICCALVAISSSLPRSFHVRGHYWSEWKGHIEDKDKYIDVIQSQAEENDARIRCNYKLLEKSAKRYRWAYTLALWTSCFFVGSQLGGVL